MNLLYLSQRLPFPPDRGDRIATFNHIKYLSRKHRVFVAALVQSKGEMERIAGLQEMVAGVVVKHQSRIASSCGMGTAFLKHEPLTIGHFRNAQLKDAVDRLIRDCRVEVAIAFSSSMAQYLERQQHLPKIMYFCDVDSQKWADLSQKSGGLKRWIYQREARLLLAYERKIAQSFSASCFVAEGEAQIFRKLIPDVPVAVIENGVDFEYFDAVVRRIDKPELTFVGVMDYPPNEEAVQFFVRQIWPPLIAKMPSARFTIVGAHPTPAVRALGSVPGVNVTGYVQDVRPYLARSALAVIPLTVARGIQNKVLEAMAAGVPVLTTPVVAGNLPPEVRAFVNISDRDPVKFQIAVLGAIYNSGSVAEKSKRAQELIRKRYSWESKVQQLEELIEIQHKEKFRSEAKQCVG